MNKTSPSHGQQSQSGQAAGLGNDLDSSLASLATNLSVGGGANQLKKDHQWQPKGDPKLTGGTTFQPMPMAPTTAWGQPGMQPAPNMPMGAMMQPMMGQPMGQPMMQPMMGMPQQTMGMPQQPMGMPGMMPMQQRMPMMGA